MDEAYLEFYVDGDVIHGEHRQLGSFSPLLDKLSEVVRKFHHESDPTNNIVPVEEPRPYVALEDDCLVMALDEVPKDLWDVDEIVDLNTNLLAVDLWDVDKVVDIQMGNEVWTVNSTLVDAGFWDSPFVTNPGVPFEEAAAQDPAFWEGLIIEDLETALGQDSPTTMASVDKGKRKMADIPTDCWDFDDNTTSWWDIANVTRSDRGGGNAYVGQVEPFWDLETRAWLPGYEIFTADTWSDSEEDVAKDELAKEEFKKQLARIKERMDWLKTFDQGSLEMLFSQVGLVGKEEEAEVLMLGPDSSDALKDPTTLIVEAKGSINNCIFTPRLTCIDNESESDTESVWHFPLKHPEAPVPFVAIECLHIEIGNSETPSADTVVSL
ncbi:hypothetical protein RHMOL_Rhmol06G0001300 [Rhododendron molle]|uniref:Uncharacterized protein n=1 Tax=Rhododendron molle TaxID=49168 RepID=A0ACC0N770_RHOML|nr:hypothetical protein RHMOL_Rhmol06G0001300 [Rhododendron molle]